MTNWTYANYLLTNYLVSSGLCVLVFVGLAFSPPTLYFFLVERVLGISFPRSKPTSSSTSHNGERAPASPDFDFYDEPKKPLLNKKWRTCIYVLLGSTISLLLVIIFDGIFLWSTYLVVTGRCPGNNPDCFFFASYFDINPQYSINCTPDTVVTIPPNGRLVCFEWIIVDQSLIDVLNILGVCGGLLSIFGAIMPFIFCLSKKKQRSPFNLASGIVAAVLMGGTLITFVAMKISISFVTWLVLVQTGALCLFATISAWVKTTSVTTVHPAPTSSPTTYKITSDHPRIESVD